MAMAAHAGNETIEQLDRAFQGAAGRVTDMSKAATCFWNVSKFPQ
jgi:hypothetical protein